MNINIETLHFNAPDSLTSFVHDRASRLTQMSDRITSCEVCLRLDKATDLENKVCEIKLLVPGHEMFAKRRRKSFEEATTDVVEALERQLQKSKGKLDQRGPRNETSGIGENGMEI